MLVRYDPFRDLDRFTEQFFGSGGGGGGRSWMAMDAVRHEHDVELFFDLPGVSPDSIDLTVERNVLSVKAERNWEPAEGDEVLAHERPYGSITRQVMLGETLDTDRLEARYDAGVLAVRIPVAEQAKPRKVEISGGQQREAIDVGTSS
jgi:HSP20 family protein